MKMLVVDDNPNNLESAEQTLGKEHELTLVSTVDEAFDRISGHIPYSEVEARLYALGWTEQSIEDADRVWRSDAWYRLLEITTQIRAELEPPKFDAVLLDLLMPAGKRALTPDAAQKFDGSLMPVGFGFVFHAAVKGARYIVLASMTNHHNHPASAQLDPLYGQELVVNESKVRIMHADTRRLDGPCMVCGERISLLCEHHSRSDGTVQAKDWSSMLAQVMR